MNIALLLPCMVNHLWPQVGIATIELLERLGHHVILPLQSCCGAPLQAYGDQQQLDACSQQLVQRYGSLQCDWVVAPSATCLLTLKRYCQRHRYQQRCATLLPKLQELSQFLHRTQALEQHRCRFAHRIRLLFSCHASYGLQEETPTSCHVGQHPPHLLQLLAQVEGLKLLTNHANQCCGMAGGLPQQHATLAAQMAQACVPMQPQEEYFVGIEPSCLLHVDGKWQQADMNLPLASQAKAIHLAQLLNLGLQ